MINYICAYEDETWMATLEVKEESDKYSILEIQSKYKDLEIFLWLDQHNYWLAMPKEILACNLSYPTDEFWNYESLYRCTEDEMVSKTIAIGISTYYRAKHEETNNK